MSTELLLGVINKSILYTHALQNSDANPYYTHEFAELEVGRGGKYRLFIESDLKIPCISREHCLSEKYIDKLRVDWFTEGKHGTAYMFLLGDVPIALFTDDPIFTGMLTEEERRFIHTYFDFLYIHFVEKGRRAMSVRSSLPAPMPEEARPPTKIRWSNLSAVREYNRNLAPATVAEGINTMKNTKKGGRHGRANRRRKLTKRR